MLILGVHMGHDAGVVVVDAGRIASFVERERHTRVKHAAISTIDDIELALADAGATIDDVDYVSITGTQNWPFVFYDSDEFRFDLAPDLAGPVGVSPALRNGVVQFERYLNSSRSQFSEMIVDRFQRDGDYKNFSARPVDPAASGFDFHGTREFPIYPSFWDDRHSLRALRSMDATSVRGMITPWLRTGAFHVPVQVRLRHRIVPGIQISHHTAHAASGFYQSDFNTAAILTTDGGMTKNRFGHSGGLFCVGAGNKLFPLLPNFLTSGNMYMRVGRYLRLDDGPGAPGKLMGLAPYGRPRFFDPDLVGNAYDRLELMLPAGDQAGGTVFMNSAQTLVARALRVAGAIGYDAVEPDPGEKLTRFNKDLAASTQKLFEEQSLFATLTLFELCGKLSMGTLNLVLSGGCALNCPANSRIWREGPFDNVFVPPSCDDSGLAIGSALYLSHHVLDLPRQPQGSRSSTSAYLGRRHGPESFEHALREAASDIVVTPVGDAAADAGLALSNDAVVAWFEGRSEIGPRALGHRSILADPRNLANWERVNRIKKREAWRPFAPAVLEEEAANWFDGAPLPSPFMLFTARVRSRALPAVTHVDGSARIQTVDPDGGGFRRVLETFNQQTGIPAVMNTSFNGPGEPIVETPEDAVRFFRSSDLDRLYFDGFRVEHR
ncbi:carbamoyltransferase C-terminal domain-containing protein [Thalassobaculum sp.]|uniref:carbamoyltransferase C-terminal domain-containing protein n=1 Tax=Thalassobaculum sp. TaxID=2022740 RepID=UPI0032EE4123